MKNQASDATSFPGSRAKAFMWSKGIVIYLYGGLDVNEGISSINIISFYYYIKFCLPLSLSSMYITQSHIFKDPRNDLWSYNTESNQWTWLLVLLLI